MELYAPIMNEDGTFAVNSDGTLACRPLTPQESSDLAEAMKLGALPLDESGTIQDEQNNAAVAAGAAMARAVLAAEYYRQTGSLPDWATDQEDPHT